MIEFTRFDDERPKRRRGSRVRVLPALCVVVMATGACSYIAAIWSGWTSDGLDVPTLREEARSAESESKRRNAQQRLYRETQESVEVLIQNLHDGGKLGDDAELLLQRLQTLIEGR